MLTVIEFTEHQRNVFCVFSGNGVTGLRHHLNREHPHMGSELDLEEFQALPPSERDDDHTMTGIMNTTNMIGEEEDADEELDASDALDS